MDFQNLVSGAVLKLEKASVVLRTAIEANYLDRTELDRDEITAIGANASNICDMMVIADEYMYHANFSFDADALLQCVSKTVLEHLKDYLIISGNVL